MLKTRIIPCLTIKDLRLVKSIQFQEHRNIGSYIAAVRVFNARDVDEMIVLDLDAANDGIKPWLLQEITKECFMPLTIGGGVKTIDDIKTLLALGADKVSINTAAIENPKLIEEASRIFGRQCIIISIDVKRNDNHWEVFSRNGTVATKKDALKWAKEVETLGAGEIFLTSIDREGMMQGYDIELVHAVSSTVNIPVIASGGAGNLGHCLDVIKDGGATAIAAASIFQYTQITPMNVKQYLYDHGVAARI